MKINYCPVCGFYVAKVKQEAKLSLW